MAGVTDKLRIGLAAAVLSVASVSLAAEAPPRPVWAEALPGSGSALTWDAPQFVQADAKGRVFVFRGDAFQVYPVTKQGALGEPTRLQRSGLTEGLPLRAAMSSDGSKWVVWNGPGTPFSLFEDGREKQIPEGRWQVDAVGWLRGSVVANVVPVLLRGQTAEDASPRLVTYDGSKWTPLVSERLPKVREDQDPQIAAVTHRSALLAGDSEGKLWVAQQYVYRVRRYSGAGKRLFEIAVGAEEPVEGADAAEASIKLTRSVDAQGMQKEGRRRVAAMTAKRIVQALAQGRDGRLYLFVAAGDGKPGYALDRYDPVRNVLERTLLRLADGEAIASMAAGVDGLYLAAFRGNGGRYRLTWEVLDAADWREVEEADIGPVP